MLRMIARVLFGAGMFIPLVMCAAPVDLRNAGLEGPAGAGAPEGWRIVVPPDGQGIHAAVDGAIRHSGASSFVVTLDRPERFTLESTPVRLTVGALYRLTGWIRTSGVQADPASRYPTAVAATFTMGSFPFTNHGPTVSGTTEWRRVALVFFATQAEDRVRLHLGLNGTATGTAWFDDIQLEEVNDLSTYIPPETVKWFGPAFRYTDGGWTFVHIEGDPYPRGYQYGYLLAKELSAYIEKLAVRENSENPKAGWGNLRTMTDALVLRKYDEEYLVEMRGIADGAAAAGASFGGKPLDFVDVVTVNSAVDLGQLGGALPKTIHPLSGRSFNAEEEEARAVDRTHKCSSFLATGPATRDGKIVFGQLFMWNGYTGVHWDIVCDVIPSNGNRLVYQTFPGGIHSGSDFYVNSAGIMIGETTVMQSPFNADGQPQSSRIRKAAQYAESIDDVVRILREQNNGLYTNDWLIADRKTGEIAILLLGTDKFKVWKSSKKDYPAGTEGFLWSDNNAKDPEVRKEYAADPGNAPVDITYSNSNRDIAFLEYYRSEKGTIDAVNAAATLGSSPINRPHACDGKITTSDMAEKMMFLAHYGKVTLREKMPEKNSRLMPDLPNVVPHLSLGYTAFSPVFVTERMRDLRREQLQTARVEHVLAEVKERYVYGNKDLWFNTVYPSGDGDNWFVSGTAAYWNMLRGLSSEPATAMASMRDALGELSVRLQYVTDREGTLAPAAAHRAYDGTKHYVIPRIRGTFLMHQLRLLLGNSTFGAMMRAVHSRHGGKPMNTAQFLATASETAGRDLTDWVQQWVNRDDIPSFALKTSVTRSAETWVVTLDVSQPGIPYAVATSVAIETARGVVWKPVVIDSAAARFSWKMTDEPRRLIFNPGNDIPALREEFYTFSNFFDDYSRTLIVYGTNRQIEANHTAALKIQTVVADQFTEVFSPVRQDAEVTDTLLATSDLIVLGGVADNDLTARLASHLGVELGKNMFTWRGKTYADPDDGLFVSLPNPLNPKRIVHLFVGNSALEQYHMTKRFQALPSWALFKGEQIVEKGYHKVAGYEVPLTGR